MKACPDCGSDTFYRKARFSGRGRINERFDGQTADNTEMHDDLEYTLSKTRYCSECHRKLPSKPAATEA